MEINLQDDKQQEDQEYSGKIFWECRAKEYYIAFFLHLILLMILDQQQQQDSR
jgi:hypothetical protein